MELLFNELSYYPLATSFLDAENRFTQLMKTFKEANAKFGFKKIQFHSNHSSQLITTDNTFYQTISSLSKNDLKRTVLSFIKKPFVDDLEEEEMEVFFESDYEITDANVPVSTEPLSLPIAHIKSTITISFNSEKYWQNRKINILKTNTSETENLNFSAYNICLDTDLKTEEIKEWSESVYSNKIDNEEKLTYYLSYNKYSFIFVGDFIEQILQWKKDDKTIFYRILLLMKDVELHPFVGGIGRTENLRNNGKEASKRITGLDRLSYTLENNKVTYIACKGHYDFH